MPRDFDDLLSLPGVGRKTANILRGNAFGLPGIGVDTHVGRLSQRLGFTTNTDPDKIEADSSPSYQPPTRFASVTCSSTTADASAWPGSQPVRPAYSDICPFPDKTVVKPSEQRAKRSRWV